MPNTNVIKKSPLAPTVIIAGGAGFIGSHLVEALLLKDARVIVLDNFQTGKDSYVNEFLTNPKFAIYNVDINAGLPAEIESVDYIFHLVDVEIYLQNKENINLDLLLTNAIGTKNLLDLANRSQAKFLLVSSTDVYRGHLSNANLSQYFGQTIDEENKYSLAEAKRFAEALVWEYFKKYNTDVRVARIPEVFGPKMNMDASGNLGLFLKDIMEKKDLTVYGDGIEKEYYLYITDVVAGIIKAQFSKGSEGKIYTLVGQEPYSTLEVAYLLKSLADREVKINFRPSKKDGASYEIKIPDTHTLRDLKWEPKVNLKDGLMKTLKWFGYEPNVHSFKPGKLIAEKSAEKMIAKNGVDTLADVMPAEKPVQDQQPAKKKFSFNLNFFGKPRNKEESQPKEQKTESTAQYTQGISPALLRVPEQPQKVEKAEEVASISPPKKGSVKKTLFMLMLVVSLVISFVAVFVAFPLFQTYVNAKDGASELETLPKTLGQFDASTSQKNANAAFQHFYKADMYFKRVNWVFVLTGKSEQYTSFSRLLTSSVYFSRSIYNVSKAISPFSSIWEVVRPNSNQVFNQDQFDKSKLDLESSKNDIQLSLAEFKYVNKDVLPEMVRQKAGAYENALNMTAASLDALLATVTDLPDILGINSPKKYLILFQNSNEIRPTGGFIGSYAVLQINKGKISDLMIDDVYNPDGQIDIKKINVPAPTPIQTILKEKYLGIRNANWSPNFPDSVEDIKGLFYKLDGEKFDGVVGVDLFFAQNLLKVTGPIFLTAYNEEINADNLYQRTQLHSDFNYADGSDQKKSFLTILGSKLLEKLFALDKEKMPQLLTQLHASLNEKHLLINVPNSSISTLLQTHAWDGSVVSTNYDYLYVVNANLGGTKANYYVKNTLAYKVSSQTRDGLLRGEVTLTYEHTGKDSAWPSGPYTDYVRVLTPTGTKLTGATIQYNTAAPKDILKDIIIWNVKRYDSFETSFVLKPTEKLVLKYTYDLPQSFTINNDNKQYRLYWQKQPGTVEDPFTFNFSPPFGMKILELNSGDGSINFEGKLTTDQSFSVNLR